MIVTGARLWYREPHSDDPRTDPVAGLLSRGRHWDGYHETMRSGITKYVTTLLRVPATHRDGGQLSIAFTVAMLHDADGRPSAVAAVIRDETSKFNEDRALRKKLAELEAKLAAYDRST